MVSIMMLVFVFDAVDQAILPQPMVMTVGVNLNEIMKDVQTVMGTVAVQNTEVDNRSPLIIHVIMSLLFLYVFTLAALGFILEPITVVFISVLAILPMAVIISYIDDKVTKKEIEYERAKRNQPNQYT